MYNVNYQSDLYSLFDDLFFAEERSPLLTFDCKIDVKYKDSSLYTGLFLLPWFIECVHSCST